MENSFQCKRCGTCCTWKGYLKFSDKEAEGMADFLNITLDSFLDKYSRLTSDRQTLSLTEKKEGSCVFYSENPPLCMIYKVRPKQCRTFPVHWNFKGWEKLCKGSKG